MTTDGSAATTFVDSSALVKFYSDEPGYEHVRDLAIAIVSHIARVEVPAALWRKQRMGELTVDEAATLVMQFEADWFGTDDEPGRFVIADLTAAVLEDAARLTGVHGLRAYDAVQLATAVVVRAVEPSCTELAGFDGALRNAAAVEGFTLVPPS